MFQKKEFNPDKYRYQIPDKAPLLFVLQNLSTESLTSPGEVFDIL